MIGTVLLVAVVVLVSATVAVGVLGFGDRLDEPSLAAVSAERTTVTDPSEIDTTGPDGCANLDGHTELAVDVTLVDLQRADVIYVIVTDEGGEEKKVLWEDPTADDVGETLTLANEVTAADGVDVDIGNPTGSDFAFCPDESATFAFYARNDGQTTVLQRFRF